MKLRCEHVCYRYKKSKPLVLHDVSLEVEAGERVGLMAPSGFGKTTLCRLLSGYDKAEKGGVFIDETPLQNYDKYCPVQLIWQHPELALNPRLKMGKTLLDAPSVDSRILDSLGIKKEWINRYPVELSGGEKQRFCIARALGVGVKFLIADEISTMLDAKTQDQIWNFLIEESQSRGIGMLVVSHKPSLLENICSRIIDLTKI